MPFFVATLYLRVTLQPWKRQKQEKSNKNCQNTRIGFSFNSFSFLSHISETKKERNVPPIVHWSCERSGVLAAGLEADQKNVLSESRQLLCADVSAPVDMMRVIWKTPFRCTKSAVQLPVQRRNAPRMWGQWRQRRPLKTSWRCPFHQTAGQYCELLASITPPADRSSRYDFANTQSRPLLMCDSLSVEHIIVIRRQGLF